MPVTRNVPATSGMTPKLCGLITGDQSVPNRKSLKLTSSKKVSVSREQRDHDAGGGEDREQGRQEQQRP